MLLEYIFLAVGIYGLIVSVGNLILRKKFWEKKKYTPEQQKKYLYIWGFLVLFFVWFIYKQVSVIVTA